VIGAVPDGELFHFGVEVRAAKDRVSHCHAGGVSEQFVIAVVTGV
jgi:hypothetical protein